MDAPSERSDAGRVSGAQPTTPSVVVEPQFVAGHYRVRELLGEGGMGVVYLAERETDGALVALKTMRSELLDEPALRARLCREAEAVRRVRHPNVVALLDSGEDPTHGPYLVFERLEGEAVADRLARTGRLSQRLSLEVIDRVLAALDAAHAVGVVHRDLKPENVFLVDNDDGVSAPYVKVIDFGISRIVADDTAYGLSKLTRTGSVVGTPVYMAPEQALADRAQDERVDVYSAGVLLYEMLAGALPYPGENYNQVLANVLSGTSVPLEAMLPGAVDPDLAAIVHRAIAREPDARFASAAEMRAALWAWRREAAAREQRETAAPPCPAVFALGRPAARAVVAAKASPVVAPAASGARASAAIDALERAATTTLDAATGATGAESSPTAHAPGALPATRNSALADTLDAPVRPVHPAVTSRGVRMLTRKSAAGALFALFGGAAALLVSGMAPPHHGDVAAAAATTRGTAQLARGPQRTAARVETILVWEPPALYALFEQVAPRSATDGAPTPALAIAIPTARPRHVARRATPSVQTSQPSSPQAAAVTRLIAMAHAPATDSSVRIAAHQPRRVRGRGPILVANPYVRP